MSFVVYMLDKQGKYKTDEEAQKRKTGLESIYKNIKFMVREE